MTRQRAGLAALAIVLGLVLVGGATAGGAAQATPWSMLAHGGSAARYLSSIGVNPTGFVIQRGHRNYAGPKCPGKGWNCTTSHRVLQFGAVGGVNSVACTSIGGGGSLSSSATSSGETCTIVQVSTTGSNTASCSESSSTTAAGTLTQTCSITQTSGSGANKATVSQTGLQGPSACSPPSGTTALQTQGGAQNATIQQTGPSGSATANVTQIATQCVSSTTTGAVSESQATAQVFTINQGPVGFDSTNPSCTNSGALTATASQSQHQHGFATTANGGTQMQRADLTGHINQCSTGLATYTAAQSEDQSLAPNSNVTQTQIGPTHFTGKPTTVRAKRALQKGVCCSFQGTNGGDTCTITQTTSQTGNPGAAQTEDLTTSADTSGNCSGNISGNQNTVPFSSSSSGQNVNNTVTCAQTVCSGQQAPTVLSWSGDTMGTFHDAAALAATLTSNGNPVAGQTVQLAVGAESCSPTTNTQGVASCPVTLNDTPPTAQASASFTATSAFLGSTVAPFAFTVNKAPTTITSVGPASVDYDNQVTLTATLSEADHAGTGIPGEPVTFTIADGSNSQTCVGGGTTNGSGVATCTFRVTLIPNTDYMVTAAFAGDADYLGSSGSQPFAVNKAPTTVSPVAPIAANYHDTAPLSAQLTESDTGFPISGAAVAFSITPDPKGTQSCSTTTLGDGTASCPVYLTADPGSFGASASFSGNDYYLSSSNVPQSFTIFQAPTMVTYTGDVTEDWNDSTTLSAKLAEVDTGAAIPSKSVTFTVSNGTSSQSCPGTTNASGVASCSFVLSLTPGPYTVTATFGTDTDYIGDIASQPYTVTPEESVVVYTGAKSGDYSDQVTLKGVLTEDTPSGPPVSGQQLKFTLGTQSCTGTTNSSGVASCTLTINQPAGPASVVTSFAGSTFYQPSNVTTAFTITQEEDELSYTGPTSAKKGSSVTLTAKLTHGSTGLSGRTITFTLGSQGCTGTTNGSGIASCTINLSQNTGNYTVKASFAGDSFYEPVSCPRSFTIKS